jgi:hypothetical protein
MKKGDCYSIVGQVGALRFDDAAVFWTSFYHLVFKENPDSIKNAVIEEKLKVCAP